MSCFSVSHGEEVKETNGRGGAFEKVGLIMGRQKQMSRLLSDM